MGSGLIGVSEDEPFIKASVVPSIDRRGTQVPKSSANDYILGNSPNAQFRRKSPRKSCFNVIGAGGSVVKTRTTGGVPTSSAGQVNTA